eukprot:scaffold1583_cov105-Isochrysis_galbana.AAC.3
MTRNCAKLTVPSPPTTAAASRRTRSARSRVSVMVLITCASSAAFSRPSPFASYRSNRHSRSSRASRSFTSVGKVRHRNRLRNELTRCTLGLISERTSSKTVRNGDSSLSSLSFFRPAIWVAAAVAARASTSHLALETDAAAAMMAPTPGKARQVTDCRIGWWMNGSSSTTATVTAAHKPDSADVKGRMAPARAPWFAYVSETAAMRDLSATASTARAIVYSTRASE